MLVYQRVSTLNPHYIPLYPIKSPLNHHESKHQIRKTANFRAPPDLNKIAQGKRSDPDGEAVVGIGSERSDQGL